MAPPFETTSVAILVLLVTHLDVWRAVERVEQLTGCLEDTPAEVELIQLVAALETWVWLHPISKTD